MSGSLSALTYRMLVCVTGALIVVLLARVPLRYVFGSRIAYLLWLLVPIAALGSVVGSLVPMPMYTPVPIPLELPDVRVPRFIPTAQHTSFGMADWIVVAWIIGVVLSAVAQWWQYRIFIRRLGVLRRLPGGAWMADAEDIGPMVLGAFPPKIVLPADFEYRYNKEEQALALAHESMHVACLDPFINIAMAAARSLLWFHPVAHLAAWYVRIDQELACDAAVLQRHSWDRYHYASAMLKSHVGGPVLSAGCGLDSHDATFLKRRISMLRTHPLPPGRRVLGVTTVALAFILSGSYATLVSAQDGTNTPTPRNDSANDVTPMQRDSVGNPGRDVRVDSGAQNVLDRRSIGSDVTTINADSVLRTAPQFRVSTDAAVPGRNSSVQGVAEFGYSGNDVTTITPDSVLRTAPQFRVGNGVTIVPDDSTAQPRRRVDVGNDITTVIDADSVVKTPAQP